MKSSKIVIRESYKLSSEAERKAVLINNIVKLLLLEYSKVNSHNGELGKGDNCSLQ